MQNRHTNRRVLSPIRAIRLSNSIHIKPGISLAFSVGSKKRGGFMWTKGLGLIVTIGLGAVLAYIFDPMGRRRRLGDERNTQVPEEMIDKTLADSFPTSDPPSWNMGKEPK